MSALSNIIIPILSVSRDEREVRRRIAEACPSVLEVLWVKMLTPEKSKGCRFQVRLMLRDGKVIFPHG